jgi:HSP20 family molecular chaperone IbpA
MERGQVYQREQQLQNRRFNKYQKVPRIFDEDTTCNKVSLPIEMTRPRNMETTNRNMWTWETNVEDFTPEEINIKVDPENNTLTLTGERQVIRRRGDVVDEPTNVFNRVDREYNPSTPTGQRQSIRRRGDLDDEPTNVLKRVVSLPENVDVNNMKTIMTKEGKLILLSPYLTTIRGNETEPCNIPITLEKDTNLPVSEYLRLLKNIPNTICVECVKDETTGEWKLLIDLDTVGFRPEDIRVHFNDEERCLTVRAEHEVVGLGKDVFHHELVLPEYIKEKELKWRILNNGVLRIEMPCEREAIREKGIQNVCRH